MCEVVEAECRFALYDRSSLSMLQRRVLLCASVSIDAVQSAACVKRQSCSQLITVYTLTCESGVCVHPYGIHADWRIMSLTGLSSFQQSVAMDRIQRIVGVLQRPNSG